MANTFMEFLKEMEEEQVKQMHEEWINNKKKKELQKALNKISDKMKKEREVEDSK